MAFDVLVVPETFQVSESSLTGQIWVRADGEDFPSQGWDDFAVVILGWWLAAAATLLDGHTKKERFRFMDGPYWFDVEAERPNARITFVDDHGRAPTELRGIEVPLFEFVRTLLAAADVAKRRCDELGWSSRDLEALWQHRGALAARVQGHK